MHSRYLKQVVGRAGTVLETCYSDHLLSHWDRQDLDRTVCAAPGLLLRPSKYQCGPGIYSNGMEEEFGYKSSRRPLLFRLQTLQLSEGAEGACPSDAGGRGTSHS
ncbi:uncharacterized protein LOC111747447 [Pteropus vampyrus]|uniref:Uncharacterized protein LOC111747447 n=1 Tax=Pteropus vampyrus TaxID=132908 RepID=A0A6P6D3K9_PTEVA|nr:uncharacterized protein LOC111747447 [Pteropus vampyrus]